jgi:hypothetical protein
MWRCNQKHSSIQTLLIIHSKFKRLIEIYENKRSKTKDHSKSQKNQFSSKDWKNDRHFYEFVTINKMSEIQKSFVSKNSQNAHFQVQWSHDRHIWKKNWHVQKRFFSTSSSIDLIDISRFFYINSIKCSSSITKAKILTIIKRFVFDKISSFDDFINKLLRACAFIMIKLLTSLFETCIQLFLSFENVQKSQHDHFKKDEKNDYIISKMYQFIIFWNIMSKIMKSIINKRITWLTKTYRLLFDFHMKCRKNRSIESTLKFFTKQIHIVWNKSTNRIVILLSLDVIEAFDTISHERLIHDLRKRKISKWIIDWMINFLQNRMTILTMNRQIIV